MLLDPYRGLFENEQGTPICDFEVNIYVLVRISLLLVLSSLEVSIQFFWGLNVQFLVEIIEK